MPNDIRSLEPHALWNSFADPGLDFDFDEQDISLWVDGDFVRAHGTQFAVVDQLLFATWPHSIQYATREHPAVHLHHRSGYQPSAQ